MRLRPLCVGMQRLRKAYAAAWELYACRQLQGWTWKCWGIACQGVPSFALISCHATLHILVGNDGSRCHFAELAGQALDLCNGVVSSTASFAFHLRSLVNMLFRPACQFGM